LLSARSLLIAREIEQKLLDLIAVVFFEVKTHPLDAVFEAMRTFID
jgi:hypothetical protein